MATGIFSRGQIRGIVVAQRVKPGRARFFVTVEALPARKTYLVVDTKPCDEAIDRSDIVVGIIMPNTEGDFHFRSTRARLRQRLGRARSVRIYERGGSSESEQLACTKAILT
jgi:hypothetical protein